MNFVYDFDGVLVETKAAIKRAWKLAGVNPPKDFWKRQWHTWCPDPEIYAERDKIFMEKCLHLVNPLPMLAVARNTGGVILTSGSERRVVAILNYLGVTECIVKCGLDPVQKAMELNRFEQPGIYFDDNWDHVQKIRSLTEWKIVHIASQS